MAEFFGPEGVVDLFGEIAGGGIGVGFADDLLVAGEVAVIDEVFSLALSPVLLRQRENT